MTRETMPEPEGPEDERFVYMVTAAGVEALREGTAAFDSEHEARRGTSRPDHRTHESAPTTPVTRPAS